MTQAIAFHSPIDSLSAVIRFKTQANEVYDAASLFIDSISTEISYRIEYDNNKLMNVG
jgi:hypothetical protein